MNSTNKKKITIRFFLYILGGAALGACLCFGILYVETPFTNLEPGPMFFEMIVKRHRYERPFFLRRMT